MATPTIKTRIAMDGEKEYKAALSEINSGLKVLNSEMKLTQTQFADNADSVEALTAKNDVLERSILSQKEKIETLRSALQNSAESFGEADKRTNAWKVSLNDAESKLISMERELEDSRKALQDAADAAAKADSAMEDMADTLDETADASKESQSWLDRLRSAFGGTGSESGILGGTLDDLTGKLSDNLPSGAGKAVEALGKIDGKAAAVVGILAAVVKSVVEVEKKLMDLTVESAANATEISNTAQTIGFTVEATQEWDYVLKTVGSSISEAQGDLSAFQEKIMDASTGTGEAAEMFGRLGASVVDQNGSLRSSEDVLLDVVNALQNMHNETERNAISSTLLGGTGEKLIPIYNKTANELEHLIQRKHELGVMSGDEIETLKSVTAAMTDYDESVQSANNSIAVEFAPSLEAFYEGAQTGVQAFGDAAEKSGLVNFFGALLEIVTSLIPLLEALGAVVEILAPIFHTLAVVLGVIADALSIVTNLIAALLNFLTFDGAGALDNLGNIASIFTQGNSATVRAWNNAWNASGNDNWRGGVTWVGENGPEPVWLPRGTRIGTAQDGRSMGGDTFYVTISAKDVQEFNDIVAIAKAHRRTSRME